MPYTHEEPFTVCTWDVDRSDRLTMASAFNFCQEVAGNHARELGVGAEWMRERKLAWVLSRMSLVLTTRPGWGARLVVRTWPRGTDRLFAVRHYELFAADGARLGVGRSAWIALNMETLRPRRVESLGVAIPDNPGLDAMADGAAAVEAREGLSPRGEHLAGYSDIDYNGHVNNARYVQWIQDAVPLEDLLAAPSLRMDINYLAEVKPGDRAILETADLPDGWYVQGTIKESGACCFRAVLTRLA
ncbi:MAG TPA: acyl-ACP thioesterase domain-containing protein [Spirochaetia bacterium]